MGFLNNEHNNNSYLFSWLAYPFCRGRTLPGIQGQERYWHKITF